MICVILPLLVTAEYHVSVKSSLKQPILSYAVKTSDFAFAYNPSYIEPSAATSGNGALLVRVQNVKAGKPVLPGQCQAPTSGFKSETPSSLAYALINKDGMVGKLAASQVLLGPGTGRFVNETDLQDPRMVLGPDGRYWLYYTAIVPTPLNGSKTSDRVQVLATASNPLDPSNWTRHGPCIFGPSSSSPYGAVQAGVKSGAVLIREKGPSFMFVYNLNNGRHIEVATSTNLVQWELTGKVLIRQRENAFDAGLCEPGPPPVRLSDGNLLFLYNAAEVYNDRKYHVGFAILNGSDPSSVIQRSALDAPLFNYSDHQWQNGTSSTHLCNVPEVVFLTALAPHGDGRSFTVYFGGADAVVGSAVIEVSGAGD
jgi:predicted GH43/DUF377 family glycosyl hydrolase